MSGTRWPNKKVVLLEGGREQAVTEVYRAALHKLSGSVLISLLLMLVQVQ